MLQSFENTAGLGDLPLAATCGSNATIVESDGDAAQAGYTGFADGHDEGQRLFREPIGGSDRGGASLRCGLTDITGLPSFVPCAVRAARAAFVRSEISQRSFSAKEAA